MIRFLRDVEINQHSIGSSQYNQFKGKNASKLDEE